MINRRHTLAGLLGAGGYGGQRNGNRPRFDIKAFTPYLTCLKGQGLDVKVSDGFNALRNLKRDDPKVQAALKTCQSKIPQRPSAPQGTSTVPARPGPARILRLVSEGIARALCSL